MYVKIYIRIYIRIYVNVFIVQILMHSFYMYEQLPLLLLSCFCCFSLICMYAYVYVCKVVLAMSTHRWRVEKLPLKDKKLINCLFLLLLLCMYVCTYICRYDAANQSTSTYEFTLLFVVILHIIFYLHCNIFT